MRKKNRATLLRKSFISLLGSVFLFACTTSPEPETKQPPLKLWYDKPAEEWMTSALPLGNGELGGMFFGGVEKERMQFNEKTLWTGNREVRGAYQNFGELVLEFPEHTSYTDYRRELNLDEAVGLVSYQVGEIRYVREYFASNPDSVIVMRITTPGHTGQLHFTVSLTDARPGVTTVSENTMQITGTLDLISYEAQVRVLNEGGAITADTSKITVSGADAVTVLLTGATNYNIASNDYVGETKEQLHARMEQRMNRASSKTFDGLKSAHLADYQPLFERVKLDLGVEMPRMTTDVLLRSYRESAYLDILYFQYGRYLMLSSSRGMNLPNNLQGIWNNSNTPPWESDIHTNINIQMNYWPAENTNLPECHMPFINYVATEALREGGTFREVARSENNRGWAVKTQSTVFAHTDWNINRPANAWYCMHLWQHFAYTCDTAYLRNTAFPVMKSTCEYWFDRLKENAEGKLIAPDEWSPEQGPWEDGTAYAQQLIWELFDQTLKAVEALYLNDSFTAELTEKFKRLDNGLAVGDWGQIKEWKEDPDQLDVFGNQHRHLSQLIALYPGNHISYHLDRKLADAAKKTLESRGDEGTGWSRAWKIVCWARLFDGDHAYKLLKSALNPTNVTKLSMDNDAGGVYENLLDAHPPFQIDGNFGATTGIAEMLVQSNLNFIHLLPALPSVWPQGSFKGLKAEGNFTIDLWWENSQPTLCRIYSGSGADCNVYYPDIQVRKIKDKGGKEIPFQKEGAHTISFPTKKGEEYILSFIF